MTMSDKVQLRDHNQPCEHGVPNGNGHIVDLEGEPLRQCPGGRELTATEMDWCSTHGMHWMHWPDDAIYCIAHHIDHDEAERIGKCVRTTVLIVRQQHGD